MEERTEHADNCPQNCVLFRRSKSQGSCSNFSHHLCSRLSVSSLLPFERRSRSLRVLILCVRFLTLNRHLLLLAPYHSETARGCDKFFGYYFVLMFALTAQAALAIRLYFSTVAFSEWIRLRRNHPPPMWLEIEVVMVEDVVMLPHSHCASAALRWMLSASKHGKALYAHQRARAYSNKYEPYADEGAQSHAQPPADGWREEVFCV